jgi:hypothetical protein
MPTFEAPSHNRPRLPQPVASIRRNITLTNAQPPSWVVQTVDIGSAIVELGIEIGKTYVRVIRVVALPTFVTARINREIQSHLHAIAVAQRSTPEEEIARWNATFSGVPGFVARTTPLPPIPEHRFGGAMSMTRSMVLDAAGPGGPAVVAHTAVDVVDPVDELLALAAVAPGIAIAIEPMWYRDP